MSSMKKQILISVPNAKSIGMKTNEKDSREAILVYLDYILYYNVIIIL